MSRNIPIVGTLPQTVAEGDTIQLPLAAFTRPQAAGGSLTLRLRKTDSTALTAGISLVQGGRVLATQTATLTTSDQDYQLTLSSQQIQSMIPPGSCDIDDGVIIVTAGAIVTPCCPDNPWPSQLHATFTNGGNCPGASGQSLELNFNGVNWNSQPGIVCGVPVGMNFECHQGAPGGPHNAQMVIVFNGELSHPCNPSGGGGWMGATSLVCNPLVAEFQWNVNAPSLCGCCGTFSPSIIKCTVTA